MTFEKAKKLLIGGFPIQHPTYGILYAVDNKQSVFACNGTMCKKLMITGMSKAIWLNKKEEYTEKYDVITSLDIFNTTENWEPVL